jgi:3'-phosphoadenosine 5'-phosphosulfate sulfotransferase (PAPS reductase)/FAD synthetase
VAATATTWPHGLEPELAPPDLTGLEARPADELLAWAIGAYGRRFAVVTSFQAEGMVVLDLARHIDPDVRVLTLDTGRLPEETYEVIEAPTSAPAAGRPPMPEHHRSRTRQITAGGA